MLICGNFNDNLTQDLYCIFDGHGGDRTPFITNLFNGVILTQWDQVKQVADYLSLVFNTCFKSKMVEKQGNVIQALRESFTEINISIESWANYMGATALSVFIRDDTVYLANAGTFVSTHHRTNIYIYETLNQMTGDTRCVLCRGGKAFRISVDHKPDIPSEVKRVMAVGGNILEKRVGGVLAVSRAIGNFNSIALLI